MLIGRLHYEVRGVYPESVVYSRCSGHWDCISTGKSLTTKEKYWLILKITFNIVQKTPGWTVNNGCFCVQWRTNKFLVSFFLSACGDDVYLLPSSKFARRSELIFDSLTSQNHTVTSWIVNCVVRLFNAPIIHTVLDFVKLSIQI